MTRLDYLKNKIVSLDEAKKRVNMWHMQGKKVVFTNGCFDILHAGHVTYLMQAVILGSRLVVGLNSDASVRAQNKGENRPINEESARALVLAGLSSVDLVVVFDEETPLDLIQALKPDILAKGADYDPEEKDPRSKKYIVGSDIIRQNGGEVYAIPFVEGFSTTSIIERSKN